MPQDTIAKNNDIGTGTVTNIITCAKNQQEDNDIDLYFCIAIRIICPLMYLFKSGHKALLLEEEFRISIEKIPEYISKSKQIFDILENQIQTQQSKLHGFWTKYETLNAKLEKIKKEYSAIEPRKLRLDLDEIKQQKESILEVKLRDRECQ